MDVDTSTYRIQDIRIKWFFFNFENLTSGAMTATEIAQETSRVQKREQSFLHIYKARSKLKR